MTKDASMDPISLGFMLSLQAAGMVVDWFGKNEQIRLGKMGQKIEQAGINSNIAQARLESEDASLQAMKALRMNLGTQAAMNAARGISNASGSAIFSRNDSLSNFNADERMRKINLAHNEASLKAGGLISNLHEKTYENRTWNEFRNNIINKIPTDPSSYKEMAKSFGLTKVGS